MIWVRRAHFGMIWHVLLPSGALACGRSIPKPWEQSPLPCRQLGYEPAVCMRCYLAVHGTDANAQPPA